MIKMTVFICLFFLAGTRAFSQADFENARAVRELLTGESKNLSQDENASPHSKTTLTVNELESVNSFIEEQNNTVLEFAEKFTGPAKAEVLGLFKKQLLSFKSLGPPPPARPFTSSSPKLSKILEQRVTFYGQIPAPEMVKRLQEEYKGTSLEVINDFYPKFFGLLAAFLRHPKALPNLSKIAEGPDKLAFFAIFFVATVLMGLFIGLFKKNIKGFFAIIAIGILQFLAMNGIRLVAFYFIFQNEVDPAFKLLTELL